LPVAQDTSSDEDVAALIEDMRRGVEEGPEIYKPGEFWGNLLARNLEMIRSDGIENLKRNVANNYYNWIVSSPFDPQLRLAVRRWLEHPSTLALTSRIERRPAGLRSLDRDEVYSLSPAAAWRYKFFVCAVWEMARREDRDGLTERLAEPEVGNPIRIRSGGRLISQDLANSIIEFSFASRSGRVGDGAKVAELGAGHGRLAYVYANARNLTYCIFDIPPALAVSQWYLTQVLGPDRIVGYSRKDSLPELPAGAVAFFTPDQLELFPDGWFDLTQTISTLPEMPARQSSHYLRMLADKSGGALFLKQWRQWRNEADDTELRESDYRLPAPWALSERRIDPIQPAFFNQLWLRG
jgi:putative sugar O-methyltransferase